MNLPSYLDKRIVANIATFLSSLQVGYRPQARLNVLPILWLVAALLCLAVLFKTSGF